MKCEEMTYISLKCKFVIKYWTRYRHNTWTDSPLVDILKMMNESRVMKELNWIWKWLVNVPNRYLYLRIRKQHQNIWRIKTVLTWQTVALENTLICVVGATFYWQRLSSLMMLVIRVLCKELLKLALYSDVMMSRMASQITCVSIVYSTVCSGASKLCVTGLCERNSLVTCEFPTQRASNAGNVSIWWRHHVMME